MNTSIFWAPSKKHKKLIKFINTICVQANVTEIVCGGDIYMLSNNICGLLGKYCKTQKIPRKILATLGEFRKV